MYEAAAPTSSGGLSFRRLALIGRRQWWVVVGCIVLAGIGSLGYVKTRTISYSAVATVTVTPASFSTTSSGNSGSSTASTSASALYTGTLNPASEITTASVAKAASDAAKAPVGLKTTLSADQSTVYVTATAPTAVQASNAANAAGNAFVKQRIKDLDAKAKVFSTEVTNFSNTISSLKAQIKAAGVNNDGSLPIELTFYEGEYTTQLAEQQVVLDAAASASLSTPSTPVTTTENGKGKKVVEVALAAGLIAGLGIALAREQFDDKIRSSAELGELSGTEVLAELPISDLGPQAATIADKPFGETAEAVRELRTAMRFLSVKRPLRTVLVTSAGIGEGKSFVAVNLAAAWAMSGVKTILVSSDLRRPSIERIFKIEMPDDGLSEAIVDAALMGRRSTFLGDKDEEIEAGEVGDIDALLIPTGVEGLQVMPAGKSPPNPAELLGSPELGKLLVALRERAEIVVLDSPPVQAVTDPLVLTAQADGVLFVVSEGRTSRGAAQRSLRLLDSGLAPVLGIVVNRSSRPQTISHY